MKLEWQKSRGIADWVLMMFDEDTLPVNVSKGYVMKSGPTTYTAWVPNDAGNRMEFFDIETAKAWVFTQVRMHDGSALLRTDSLR